MTRENEGSGHVAEMHRMLAVVSGCVERASEVRAQFAAMGEAVETFWYATPRELVGRAEAGAVSAVLLFNDERDAAATDEAEVFLRRSLAQTPLFRVAA